MPLPRERGPYAEDTAQEIDAEIKRIMTDAHEQARRTLRNRRDVLDTVANRLLEKEVIEGEELRQLLGDIPAKDPENTSPPALPPEPPVTG